MTSVTYTLRVACCAVALSVAGAASATACEWHGAWGFDVGGMYSAYNPDAAALMELEREMAAEREARAAPTSNSGDAEGQQRQTARRSSEWTKPSEDTRPARAMPSFSNAAANAAAKAQAARLLTATSAN